MEHDSLLTRELLGQRPHDPARDTIGLLWSPRRCRENKQIKPLYSSIKGFIKEPSAFGCSCLTLSSTSSVLNHLHVVHTSPWCSSRPPVQPQRPSTDVLTVHSLKGSKPSQSFPYSSPSSSSFIFPVIAQLFIVPPLSSGLSALPLLSLPIDSSSCSNSSTHNFDSRR